MRLLKHYIIILFIGFSTYGYCQKTVFISSYQLPAEVEQTGQLIIEMPFGKSNIIKISGDTTNLENAGDIYVDVICTDYPENASLQVLNKNRVSSFLNRFPFLDRAQLAQINFFQQTDGALRERAMTMFHGLIVTYRPRQSFSTMTDEVEKLEELLKKYSVSRVVKPEAQVKQYDSAFADIERRYKNRPRKFEKGDWYILLGRVGTIATELDIQKKTAQDSFVTMSPKEALKGKLISKSEYKEFKWTSSITLYYPRWFKLDSVHVQVTKVLPDSTTNVTGSKAPDSTISKIFGRGNWGKPTIVGDVTGSMYPYIAQLLIWVKINAVDSITKKFVFFNDGDSLPDNRKKLGSTGGIYYKTCNGFNDVLYLVKSTMLKGGGGDCAENDIEALLLGEKMFPDSEYQILIADNWAPIKDKVLWQKLKKPVRIVLCGATEHNVNIDYLNLARQTKGSVHTIEQDLPDLALLREGEILKTGNNIFIVKNGMFVEITDEYIFK